MDAGCTRLALVHVPFVIAFIVIAHEHEIHEGKHADWIGGKKGRVNPEAHYRPENEEDHPDPPGLSPNRFESFHDLLVIYLLKLKPIPQPSSLTSSGPVFRFPTSEVLQSG